MALYFAPFNPLLDVCLVSLPLRTQKWITYVTSSLMTTAYNTSYYAHICEIQGGSRCSMEFYL